MRGKKISIVITGRNDNYGGDFNARLQRCVSYNHQELTSHKIDSELIFVKWIWVAIRTLIRMREMPIMKASRFLLRCSFCGGATMLLSDILKLLRDLKAG